MRRSTQTGRPEGGSTTPYGARSFPALSVSARSCFSDEALDKKTQKTRSAFPCPHCSAELTKNNLERSFETLVDPASGETWKRIRLRAVLVNYSVGKARHQKEPDSNDLSTLDLIRNLEMPPEIPTNAFPIDEMYHGSRLEPKGFTRLHHMFLPRAAHALAAMWRRASGHKDSRLRNTLLFFVEQAIWGMSVLNRYGPLHFSQVNRALTGVYYVASQVSEVCPWYILNGKLGRLMKAFEPMPSCAEATAVSTGDCSGIALTDNSIDYVFTDPPFGENIYYADLNFLIESWHGVRTNAVPEAIVDRFKKKGLTDYQHLMQRCFAEYLSRPQARPLDDGRLPQFQERGVERYPGGDAGRWLRGRRRTHPRQTARLLPAGHKHRRQTGLGDLRVQTEPRPGGTFQARSREPRTASGTSSARTCGSYPYSLPTKVGPRSSPNARTTCSIDRMVAFHVQRGVKRFPFPLLSFMSVWNNGSPRAKGCTSCPNRRPSMTRSA